MTNEELILDTLKKKGKPMKAGDIATSAGIEKDTVSKTLKELKKMGLVDSPKACFYGLVGK